MAETLQDTTEQLSDADAARVVEEWLQGVAAAIAADSAADLAPHFAEMSSWRDFMAFPWDFHNAIGRDAVVAELLANAREWRAAGFAVNREQAPVPGPGHINAFFDFTTTDRVDRGYVRLVPGADGRWVGATLQTQAVRLLDRPERLGHHRPVGKVYDAVPGRTRWADERRQASSFEDREPTVVILGAGHNGLSIAAQLGAFGVDALVLEREARVGDTWRKRYASLALHSIVYGDNLPYMDLPPTWTEHTPKDKWADFLESYATLMDLNVWTSTEFLTASHDEATERWTLEVRMPDGSIRELHPRHFVLAAGLFADPKIPDIPGLDTFTGVHSHTDSFQDGAEYDGRKALVVGAGVSGHELAHDLWEHGADVTMLQRSSTYVVSFDANHHFWNPLFVQDMVYSQDFADQMAYATPNVLTDPINKRLVKEAADFDRELLDKLEAVGFKLNYGPDGTGILGAHMGGKDAYQIDIGASSLVAEGKIKLKQGVELSEIRGDTAVFSDGSELPGLDLIVFGTGYHQFGDHIKPKLGAVAERLGKVYGRAEDGEYADVWRRSAQPGLWFGTGFIRMTKFYSRFMVLLITAIEAGLIPYDPSDARD